ncbi:MAG TPA: phytoene desaturase family protein [Bacteroidales bacterium]|nr:phytoene desaturase family protein [Bacteroidales bacterium]
MKNLKTAVIIGAGTGGIATAIFLAQKGFKVIVYEQSDAPGGRCSRIVRDGHRFDLGATIFLMPEIYRDVFKALGIPFDQAISYQPVSDIYRLYFTDGTTFRFTTDRKVMEKQMEAMEPGSYSRFLAYVEKGYGFYKIALKELLGRNYTSLFQFITLRNICVLFRIKTLISHMRYVRRFFKHPHLQTAFTFQNIYVGQNPFTAPALFAMLPAAEITQGSLVAQGGMFSVVEALQKKAEDLGVKIHCNSSVSRILTTGNKTTGVELEDGKFIPSDIVVANADLPYVYKELLQEKGHASLLDKLKYSCSAISFHWALDKPYSQLGLHNVFMSEKYKHNLDKIFRDKTVSGDPSFYVYCPRESDPGSAPEGQDTMSVVVPVGHLHRKNKNQWDKLAKTVREGVLERLEQQGFTDLEKHIKFEICLMPETWEKNFHITKGSVFGSISHFILQMGYFRPHNRHRRYHNLYFTGGSTHPGNGVPLVLMSAQLTSERIFEDMQDESSRS